MTTFIETRSFYSWAGDAIVSPETGDRALKYLARRFYHDLNVYGRMPLDQYDGLFTLTPGAPSWLGRAHS